MIVSLAGRTATPVAQPVPVRSGGFGGVDGLRSYLRAHAIDLVVDATHPYAARMSANAALACTAVPLLALRRPAWLEQPGDRWRMVESSAEAVVQLGREPRHVFLALGRQEVMAFEAAPWHRYLIRSVDPIEPPLAVPNAAYILDRGPFPVEAERRLLADHGIQAIVAKNSGGEATYGKIIAARELGIEVLLIRRPAKPDVPTATTVQAMVELVKGHGRALAKRGE